MLRLTCRSRMKHPRNTDVGPEYDRWFEKYDSWAAFNKMRKLAGTGFYVPPDWYQHFRMFPPPHNLAREEHTLNPQAHDPHIKTEFEKNEDRHNLRDALGRASRSAASAGNRYMNIFWIQKPLDEMERSYYSYTSENGMTHEEAFKRVVDEYYAKQAVRMRVRQIQREEVALSGKCLSMKEGIALIHTLSTLQKQQLPPQELASLSESIRNTHKAHSRHTSFRHEVKKQTVQETADMLAGKSGKKPVADEVAEVEGSEEDEVVSNEEKPEKAKTSSMSAAEVMESIDAPASSLENATMSVARERVARHGSFTSEWYSSAQDENAEIQPEPAHPEVKPEAKQAEQQAAQKVESKSAMRKPIKISPITSTSAKDQPKDTSKLLRRPIIAIDKRKI